MAGMGVHRPVLNRQEGRCSNDSPPWFTGRWRDWHRGHGCDKDDGEPRTPEGALEIEKGLLVALVIAPVGGLHWDQRLLDLLTEHASLDWTSAECEAVRRFFRSELAEFGAEVAAAIAKAKGTLNA